MRVRGIYIVFFRILRKGRFRRSHTNKVWRWQREVYWVTEQPRAATGSWVLWQASFPAPPREALLSPLASPSPARRTRYSATRRAVSSRRALSQSRARHRAAKPLYFLLSLRPRSSCSPIYWLAPAQAASQRHRHLALRCPQPLLSSSFGQLPKHINP